MRSTLRVTGVVLAALLVAAACGGGAGPGAPAASQPGTTGGTTRPKLDLSTYQYGIQTKGKLRVGTREDNIPFGRKDPLTNRFEGFDVDVARELARAIFGNETDIDKFIEYVPVVSATRIPTLDENKADFVIATFTINEDRKKQIDFSDVYFRTGQKIMVKKDNTTIKDVKDLNGKRVCSAQGSTSEVNIRKEAPQATLQLVGYPECLILLQQNRVDAVSTDETILFGLVKQDPNMKIVGSYFSDEPYGIGVKKSASGDRTGFVDFINRTLVAMIQDGRWATFYKAHISPVSSDEKRTPDQR